MTVGEYYRELSLRVSSTKGLSPRTQELFYAATFTYRALNPITQWFHVDQADRELLTEALEAVNNETCP